MSHSFQIIDRLTGAVVATAKSRKSASRIVDRKDNAYGGYRYSARMVANA
jgi:hypothetical protein